MTFTFITSTFVIKISGGVSLTINETSLIARLANYIILENISLAKRKNYFAVSQTKKLEYIPGTVPNITIFDSTIIYHRIRTSNII